MVFRNHKFSLIFILILLLISTSSGISFAALSMDEVQYLFKKEKGTSWEEATPQEQKDFADDVRKRDEYRDGAFKDLNESYGDSHFIEITPIAEGKEPRAPYNVRSSFEEKFGIEWNAATEKEQENFWEDYKRQEEKRKEAEQKYLEKQKRLEQKKIEAFKKKKELLERKERARQKRKEKQLEKKRKREERNREALKKAKERLKEMREKAKRN